MADLMAEIDRLAIAQRIAHAREESGLKQHELADLMHVHPRTVQNWESQTKPIVAFDRLDEIASATGTSRFWLLHGAELPGSAEDAASLAEILRRLAALEAQVETQGKAMTSSVDAVARDLRSLTRKLARQGAQASSETG